MCTCLSLFEGMSLQRLRRFREPRSHAPRIAHNDQLSTSPALGLGYRTYIHVGILTGYIL